MEICEVATAGNECRVGHKGEESRRQQLEDVFSALLGSLVEPVQSLAREQQPAPDVGQGDMQVRTWWGPTIELTSLPAGPPQDTVPDYTDCPGSLYDLETAVQPHETPVDQLASEAVPTRAHMLQPPELTSRMEHRESTQEDAEPKPRAIRADSLFEQAEPIIVRWPDPAAATRPVEPHPPELVPTGSGEQTAGMRAQSAEGGPAEALEPSNAHGIADMVIERVRFIRTQGVQTVEIQLKPERLGKLLVSVSVDEQGVSAHLKLQNPEARALVESHLAELRTALAERGMTVLSLVVAGESTGTGRYRVDSDRRHYEDKNAAQVQKSKRTTYVPVRAAAALDCRV